MDFSEALKLLKAGNKIQRRGWNGKRQFLELAVMDKCSMADGEVLTNPKHERIGSYFIMFFGTSGYQCGWLASQADMLADDWQIYKED